jgi:pimeloyl-ACP methyl ester carboxylesterase
VLFTVGEFDEANPEIVRRHAALVPGAAVTVIPGAAHITAWDNTAANLAAVRGFLREADTLAGASR